LIQNASSDHGERETMPPQILKKSGEVVKSALRESPQISGTPTTPTKKAVHFSENLEQVRHFLQDEILQGGPMQWEATVTNYSTSIDGDRQFVQFKTIHLSKDSRNLIGAVNVVNIASKKQITARFTIDGWETVSEATAEYHPAKEPVTTCNDQFQFTIPLPTQIDLQTK
jgi:hypothetical protein